MAAINPFTAAMVALTAAIVTRTAALTPAIVAFAVALAACAAFVPLLQWPALSWLPAVQSLPSAGQF